MIAIHDVHSNNTGRVEFQGLGTTPLLRAEETGGAFAVVEHDLGPRLLGAPLHTHAREDEHSYVVAGRLGVQIGDEVLIAGPGELVTKPRGIPHAFWNAGDDELRIVELITPGGFERYFEDVAPLLQAAEIDGPAMGAVMARYSLDMDLSSIEALVREHGLAL
jgi:quercetin dioxygenase-like cupin family protein